MEEYSLSVCSLNVYLHVYCLRVSVRGEEQEVTILGIMISLAESHSALSARDALNVCVGGI